MAELKKLTAKQFTAAARKHPRMAASTVAAARAVLVDRWAQNEVAAEFGIFKSQLSVAVSKIFQTHLDFMKAPPGWQTITVTLPPEQVDVVRKIEREAKTNYEKTKRKKPIKKI